MIDTHTHVIGADHARYPLNPRPLSGEWYLEAPHTAEELRDCMDEAGVEQAVLVQAVGAYMYENDYAADSSVAYPERFASACCIDPLEPNAADRLRYWLVDRGMHGMRIFAIARQDSWLCDERTFAVWQQAADLGAHVIVTAFENQLDELRSMLRRFPDVRVSLDHCGFVDAQKPERLLALADEGNLFCKISSIVLASAGEECGAFVESLVGAFGSERVMWGSDFCQTHDRSYVELVALARRGFSGLSDAQRQDCFVDTPRLLWTSLA